MTATQHDKPCRKCGSYEWQVRRNGDTQCLPCRRASGTLWRRANPKKIWAQNIKSHYGLTPEAFGVLMGKQEGMCGICGRILKVGGRGPWHTCVDHCHETGKVRGLLCSPCNRGLGLLGDNEAGIEKVITYFGMKRI